MNSCGLADADRDLLQADELADAVVDVDDVVADLQVAEVREERAGRGCAGARGRGAPPRRRRSRRRATSPASGSRKPRDSAAGADEQRGGVRVLGAIERRGHAARSRARARAAARRGPGSRRRTRRSRRARAACLTSAIQSWHAAAELDRRLAGDVAAGPRRGIVGRADGELIEAGGAREPRRHLVPVEEQRGRGRRGLARGARRAPPGGELLVARLHLLEEATRGGRRLLRLDRDVDRRAASRRSGRRPSRRRRGPRRHRRRNRGAARWRPGRRRSSIAGSPGRSGAATRWCRR